MVVGDAARDDAGLPLAAFDAVQRRRLGEFLQRGDAFFHEVFAFFSVGRSHHIFRAVFFVGAYGDLGAFSRLNERLAVADTRADAE
ncbi:hypothetical protein SDC9_189574 [bioreactor metagenome]|uniref:Uncharacterized protein n=1 Tax=bioreactor metagenome TaxID=1076179 RepID=A0A645HSJ3_9ZZZZ